MTKARTAALVIATAAATLSLPNHAQVITHWYFGAGFHKSDHEVPDQNRTFRLNGGGTRTLNTTADTADNGWKLFGGYQLHRHFAVEAAFIDLGKFSRVGTNNFRDVQITSVDDQVTIDADSDIDIELNPQGFSLTGIALLPLSRSLSLNARAGVIFSNYQARTRSVIRLPGFTLGEQEFAPETVRDRFSETVNDVEFIAGVGCNYRPLSDWSIGFQWER